MSITAVLQQQYNRIEREWLRYQNNPYDADRVHDLRVAIRTLRGLIKFLKRQMPQAVYQVLNADLGQAARLFGPLRDLDVLIGKAGEFAVEHPQAGSAYRGLFDELHDQRNQLMEQTLSDSAALMLTTCLTRVKTHLDNLIFKGHPDQAFVKEFKRRDQKLMKQYQNLDFHDYPRVHHVRKRAKTLRYSAAYFSPFLPKKSKKVLRQAKHVQDVCGLITDAHVNDGQLHRLADKMKNSTDRQLLLQMAQAQRKIYTANRKTILKKAAQTN
ncbi:CHAD domain-containing protein [Lentilactobacillus raoultii]|uniref:CHAD domain-containing protein n=1 Tax=Lentilactobacillus raoultii TaxID=1987503 RepID=A0ABW3PH67_9LACO|nr:CHAD domain-containing protein [Lentilactobacillus raoultii]